MPRVVCDEHDQKMIYDFARCGHHCPSFGCPSFLGDEDLYRVLHTDIAAAEIRVTPWPRL